MSSKIKREPSCDEKSSKKTKLSNNLTQTLSCPISLGLLVDPVLAEDGQIYERKAIEQWLERHENSPLNPDKTLNSKKLLPVRAMQKSVEEFVKSIAIEEVLLEQWNMQKKEYDLSKAEALYHKGLVMDAAILGYPKAQAEVSEWYYRGKNGMEVNHVKGFEWAMKAVEAGDLLGAYNLAWYYWQGSGGLEKDISKTINLFKTAADQGHQYSMKYLGDIYRDGGCELDRNYLSISVSWYLKSAKSGNYNAMLEMGRHQRLGKGVDKDYDSAWDWFSKVKGSNSLKPETDFEMGKMMMKGEGVSMDMSEGIKLIELSASNGFLPAKNLIKLILTIE